MCCIYFSDDNPNPEGDNMTERKSIDDVKLHESVNTDDGNGGDNTLTSNNLQIILSHIINRV